MIRTDRVSFPVRARCSGEAAEKVRASIELAQHDRQTSRMLHGARRVGERGQVLAQDVVDRRGTA